MPPILMTPDARKGLTNSATSSLTRAVSRITRKSGVINRETSCRERLVVFISLKLLIG
jgi:hypothetical protein